jgi:hypothetical protein
MSTTNDPYVAFRPFGIYDRRINRIVFVLYNLFISLSGQITTLAISRKMTLSVFWVDGWLILVLAEIEKQ